MQEDQQILNDRASSSSENIPSIAPKRILDSVEVSPIKASAMGPVLAVADRAQTPVSLSSVEMRSPMWQEDNTWTTKVKRWMGVGSAKNLEPRLDLAVSIGGDTVTVVSGKRMTGFPALLAADIQGKVTAIGEEAAELEGREPEGIHVIRPIRGGVIYDPNGALRLLKAALKQRFLLSGSPNLLLAVSTQTAALDERSWLELGRQAGGHETYLVSQLLAAALGAGVPVLEPKAQLMLHFGAGSCEAGVVALGSCLKADRNRLGGDLITSSMLEYIRHKYGLVTHRRSIEKLKFELDVTKMDSHSNKANLWGRRVEDGQPTCMEIDKSELANHIHPMIDQWCSWVQQFISELPVEWLEDIRDGGLILTGGSAALIGLPSLLSERLGLRVEVAKDPSQACSAGMSIILSQGEIRHAILAPRQLHTSIEDYRSRKVLSGNGVGRQVAVAALLAASVGLALQGKMSGWTPESGLAGLTTPVLAVSEQAGQRLMSFGNPNQTLEKMSREQQLYQTQHKRGVEALEQENQRLWKWLGLREVTPNGRWLKHQPLLAQVIGRDPRGWLSHWTLDVGSQQGIRVGQVVVAQQGLVGKVVDVASQSCTVRPFVDSTSVVSGQVKGRKTSGVVLGQSQPQLEMKYLDPNSGVKVGDLVLTNGQDKQLPPGIEIGVIRRVESSNDSSFLNAHLIPSVNFSDVSEVLVLREGLTPGAPTKKPVPALGLHSKPGTINNNQVSLQSNLPAGLR